MLGGIHSRYQLRDRLGVSQAKPNTFFAKAELQRKRNMGAEKTFLQHFPLSSNMACCRGKHKISSFVPALSIRF